MMQRRFADPSSCPLENCSCLSNVVASSLDGIIYVNDPETYEVLWINDRCMSLLGLERLGQHKCYELFQGLDAPCPFCPMNKLTCDAFHIWEFYNRKYNKHFLVKDKFIRHKGRLLHLEIAVDITEKVLEHTVVRQKLEFEQTLLQCVRILLEESDATRAIEKSIELAGKQYHADRCYVFESSHDANNRRIIHNTHEWCAPGIEPQRRRLQNLPFSLVSPWMTLFLDSREVVIDDVEDIREAHPDIYALLRRQKIRRLFAVPLRLNGVLTGFIGVDNPSDCLVDFTLLHSLAYFIDNTLSRIRMADNDLLTGLGNRNAYQKACRRLAEKGLRKIGVIYVDLNNLKVINDTYGHEKGDEYIASMSAIFARHFRSGDIFRIGGDEFVFFCQNIMKGMFHKKIRNMRQECERKHPGSLSLGALWKAQPSSLDTMIRECDRRMYLEKKKSKTDRLLRVRYRAMCEGAAVRAVPESASA